MPSSDNKIVDISCQQVSIKINYKRIINHNYNRTQYPKSKKFISTRVAYLPLHYQTIIIDGHKDSVR